MLLGGVHHLLPMIKASHAQRYMGKQKKIPEVKKEIRYDKIY